MNFQTNLLTPYLTIWTKPRSTIRQILDFNPEKHVLLLAMLSGIYRFIDRASGQSLGDNMSLTSLLLLCVIGGGIVGIISLYIGGEFFRWVGSWLGGKVFSSFFVIFFMSFMFGAIFIFLIATIIPARIIVTQALRSHDDTIAHLRCVFQNIRAS